METTSGATPLPFEVGTPLFYVVVGAGSVMTLLLCVILILCVAIGYLVARKRRTYTVTATPGPQPGGEQTHNEEGHTPDQQQQLQSQPQGNDSFMHAHTHESFKQNEWLISCCTLSHSAVADSEPSQPQNTYDIQNPEYDVIEDRGELNYDDFTE